MRKFVQNDVSNFPHLRPNVGKVRAWFGYHASFGLRPEHARRYEDTQCRDQESTQRREEDWSACGLEIAKADPLDTLRDPTEKTVKKVDQGGRTEKI